MKMEQIKSEGNRWGFTGTLPMELARKTWPDRYAAVSAAEKLGYCVMANGSCIHADDPPTRVKSEDGLGSRRVADRVDGYDRDDLGESPDY